jgi:hypothetical protein
MSQDEGNEEREELAEEVPKYIRDRKRREFMTDMAATYPDATFAQVSEICRKSCGTNLKSNYHQTISFNLY